MTQQVTTDWLTLRLNWMRFTSCCTSSFAQFKHPSPVHFKLLSGLRKMATKTIAVLDEEQLHDGQM